MVISNSFHKCTCHSRVRQTDRQIKIVLEIPNLPQLNSNNESPSNRLPSFTATHSVHQRTCRHIWLCFHANHLRTSPHAARQTIITIIISQPAAQFTLQFIPHTTSRRRLLKKKKKKERTTRRATSPGEGAERNSIKKVPLRPCVLSTRSSFGVRDYECPLRASLLVFRG